MKWVIYSLYLSSPLMTAAHNAMELVLFDL